MKRVYHILAHSLEVVYPEIGKNPSKIMNLEHSVNRFIEKLKKYDRSKKFDHILVNLSNTIKRNRVEGLHKRGYKIVVLKSSLLYYPIEASLSLIKFIKNLQDCIIHIHGTSSMIYEHIAMYLRNKPSIAHYRGGHFTWKSFPISSIKYGILQPISLRMVKKIFVQNKHRAEIFIKKYKIKEEKVVHIPNAIDLDDVKGPISIDKNDTKLVSHLKCENSLYLLFVGRVERAKGVTELLKAFNILERKYKNLKLLIVGRGSLEEFVRKKASQNPNIIYLGYLNFDELKKIYKISDIFVLPTYYDSFPNVVLEAMAFELPIVSTKVEGPMEEVEEGKNGFLVKPRNVQQLVEKISYLIENEKERRKMGKLGKKIVEKKFNWKIVAKKIFEVYDELI